MLDRLRRSQLYALPVETVTRYELIVNLKTAHDIGITIPFGVLKRADQVIQ